MSDAPASLKWSGAEGPVSKSGDSASAKNTTSPRRNRVPVTRAAGWTPSPSRVGVIRFAHSQSGDSVHLRGVFGRRRAIATNRDEY